MKTKSFFLGLFEGAVIAVITALLSAKALSNMIGFDIPSNIKFPILMIVAFAVVLLVSNNVRKLGFAEFIVPTPERVLEWLGGILALIIVTTLILTFS